jgi:hypothetical protein
LSVEARKSKPDAANIGTVWVLQVGRASIPHLISPDFFFSYVSSQHSYFARHNNHQQSLKLQYHNTVVMESLGTALSAVVEQRDEASGDARNLKVYCYHYLLIRGISQHFV